MTEWNTDERFLDFVVKKFESEGGDTLKSLVGTSKKEYNMNDLADEMRQGTRMGKALYTTLYQKYGPEFSELK